MKLSDILAHAIAALLVGAAIVLYVVLSLASFVSRDAWERLKSKIAEEG